MLDKVVVGVWVGSNVAVGVGKSECESENDSLSLEEVDGDPV